MNVRFGSKADIHTFRTIIPRTLHNIDSSSYGSVCQEQLIYSQWACEGKDLPCEGLTELLFDKNLFWNLFGRAGAGMIRRSDEFFGHTGTKFS